jgi:hypothetical protein
MPIWEASTEAGYVSLSRGRTANHLYVPDTDQPGARSDDDGHLDRLAARLSRRRTQTLATRQLPHALPGTWQTGRTNPPDTPRIEGISRRLSPSSLRHRGCPHWESAAPSCTNSYGAAFSSRCTSELADAFPRTRSRSWWRGSAPRPDQDRATRGGPRRWPSRDDEEARAR